MCHSSSSSCCDCSPLTCSSPSSALDLAEEMELACAFEKHVTLHHDANSGGCHQQEAKEEEEVHQYRVFSEVASSLLGAPMARVVSLQQQEEPHRLRVLASHGCSPSAHCQRTFQGPTSSSFEEHAIRSPHGMIVVNDASADPRFHNLSEVTDGPQVRFVASVALLSRNGQRLGAISVMDVHPRPQGLCEEEITTLQEVASEVVLLMEKRQYLRVIERSASSPNLHTNSRPTNMLNFLRLLEMLVESFAKQVNVYLSMERPIPEHLTFSEAEAFGSALAVLKCACDHTVSGYIHLRLSVGPSSQGLGDSLTFECENTAPPTACNNGGSSPCLPVVANYMSSVGGCCGSRSRCAAAPSSSHPGKGSVVWFSLPVLAC